MADPSSRTGMPSSSVVSALQRTHSLTSRVLEDPSACFPGRSATSSGLMGIPVPSRPRYRTEGRDPAGSGSMKVRSSPAISSPRASAIRSTCLGLTERPARSFKNAPPFSKESSAPTIPTMRRTPGVTEAPSIPRVRSFGKNPVWQERQR